MTCENEATANKAGTISLSLNQDGAVTSVNLVDRPMYWYDGAWHPYPKDDKITVAEQPK